MGTGRRDEYSDADFWDRLVQGDPGSALAAARSVLDEEGHDQSVRALARAAVARALFETGSLGQALGEARRALVDVINEPAAVIAPVTMSATAIIAEAGFVDEALAGLHDLADQVHGVDLGRVQLQVAYVLFHAGRLNEALAEFDRSERLLMSEGNARDRSRLHLNRGLVLLQQGRLHDAASDFDTAEAVAAEVEMRVVQALAVANRAVLLGRARRLAESLIEFERARDLLASSGNPRRLVAITSIDRAEVMMHSGLLVDAVQAGRSALEVVEPSGNAMLLGDAYLMLARAELAAGLVRSAISSADRAAATFTRTDRTQMVPHARSVMVQARLAGVRSAAAATTLVDEAVVVAAALREAGWDTQADDLGVARIRSARRWGIMASVRGDVERLRAGIADGRRDTLLPGWWAEALARVAADDFAGAVEACQAGLSVLDDIVAEASTLEERSAAMRMGRDLSQLLIEIAIDRSDADTVLAAAEGTRARALHDELADPERYRPLTNEGADRLRTELAARLHDRSLVEWLVLDDRVWAVVFDAAGSRLVDVASRTDVVRAGDRVRMWLDIAVAEPDGSSRRAAMATQRLDDLLLAPLGLPPDTGVVMVPTGVLHGIPWSGLPSLADRPFSLAPNAQLWLEADRRTARRVHSVGLIVGPDVVGTEVERVAVERSHPGVALAVGDGAVASSVRSMFAGTDLVHVAAHGTFRSDHPLLSTLRLVDGDATMYDAVPELVHTRLVVLSSCEGGAQGTADGSEVLGLSSLLLARGAAAVLAPLTQVRELECAEFVAEVHGELAAGESLGCAVAAVRQRWLADDDLSRWAVASSFTCFGSGAVSLAR